MTRTDSVTPKETRKCLAKFERYVQKTVLSKINRLPGGSCVIFVHALEQGRNGGVHETHRIYGSDHLVGPMSGFAKDLLAAEDNRFKLQLMHLTAPRKDDYVLMPDTAEKRASRARELLKELWRFHVQGTKWEKHRKPYDAVNKHGAPGFDWWNDVVGPDVPFDCTALTQSEVSKKVFAFIGPRVYNLVLDEYEEQKSLALERMRKEAPMLEQPLIRVLAGETTLPKLRRAKEPSVVVMDSAEDDDEHDDKSGADDDDDDDDDDDGDEAAGPAMRFMSEDDDDDGDVEVQGSSDDEEDEEVEEVTQESDEDDECASAKATLDAHLNANRPMTDDEMTRLSALVTTMPVHEPFRSILAQPSMLSQFRALYEEGGDRLDAYKQLAPVSASYLKWYKQTGAKLWKTVEQAIPNFMVLPRTQIYHPSIDTGAAKKTKKAKAKGKKKMLDVTAAKVIATKKRMLSKRQEAARKPGFDDIIRETLIPRRRQRP